MKDTDENLLDTLRRIDELPPYLHEICRREVIKKWRSQNRLVTEVLEGSASVADTIAEIADANAEARFFGRYSRRARLSFNQKAEETKKALSGIFPARSLNTLDDLPTDFRNAALKSFALLFGGYMLMWLLVTVVFYKSTQLPMTQEHIGKNLVISLGVALVVWLTSATARAEGIERRRNEAANALESARFLDRMLRRQSA